MTLPEWTRDHRRTGRILGPLRCAILTVSDSRTPETDESGELLKTLLGADGHEIAGYAIVPNDPEKIRREIEKFLTGGPDAILCTGGTGLSPRDRTVETVRPMFERELPGFGEIFRLLSFQEQIGTAAILSRAVAGTVGASLVVAMPGSTAAVRLALTRILLPELGHIAAELRKGGNP